MVNYISDSEVEEVVSPAPAQIRPRVVRRPVPVRAQSAASGQDSTFGGAISDSDGFDDDEDFFRINRAPSATEEEIGEAAMPKKTLEPREPPSDSHIVSLENSDSDGEADEQDNERPKKHPAGEKRRHYAEGNGEQERRVRSRSVSLTPPPEAARNHAESERWETDQREPTESFVLDSESEAEHAKPAEEFGSSEDTSDLDPALQAVIRSEAMTPSRGSVGPAQQTLQPHANSPATRTQRNAVLEKVQIEFRFMFDPEFLASELPCMWEKQRWGRVKPTSTKTIEKKLNGQVAVIAFTSDLVANALKAYSDAFYVDVLATDPVLMNGTMRVFPTSTVASLGSDLAFYIKVFPRSVYNRWHEREALEKARLAQEREQARKDMEMVRALQEHAAAHGVDELQDSDENEQPGGAPAAGGIRIKIRDRAGRDTLLLVTAETSVETVIRNYRQLAKLPEATSIQLEFDDEALDPSDTIGDTEIEDDDMLTAIWK
ncbi:hypothetical protein LPJ79_004140 [Coemansia sp. RSA 1821]|nr:hypothetical protein BX667DRAFT_503377 [Coemansia mojavensis]KAJ1740567.1 hypothetical protein LPJ68_003635 [Coemansia sp. RSA 1086]KAJ1748905.1 hypothetical protein LPJ79_004140 [Coemansia sp. RSA 1821]KAJ2672719.1 hypothetical protein IWW42_002668 [Coemansia sp. RSA 1085]